MPRSEPDHLVDAETAAAYVARLTRRPCAVGTIRSAASRGHIGRHGRRGRNTLYDLRELHRWATGEDPTAEMGSLDDPAWVAAELQRRGLHVFAAGEKPDDWDDAVRWARLGGAKVGDIVSASTVNRGRLIEAMEADR